MKKIIAAFAITVTGLVPAVASAHDRSLYVKPLTDKGARVSSNHGGYNDRPRYTFKGGTDWISADLYDHSRNGARKFSKTLQTRTGSYTIVCSYTLNCPWWAFDALPDSISAVSMKWHDSTSQCGW